MNADTEHPKSRGPSCHVGDWCTEPVAWHIWPHHDIHSDWYSCDLHIYCFFERGRFYTVGLWDAKLPTYWAKTLENKLELATTMP